MNPEDQIIDPNAPRTDGAIDPIQTPTAQAPDGAAIERLVSERVAHEIERRLAAQPAPAPPATPSLVAGTPVERAQAEAHAQGIFSPEWVTNRAIQLAQHDTERRILSAVAPHLQRLTQKDTVNELASGLGAPAREYLQRLAPGIDPANLTSDVRDLLVRAARDYEREKIPARAVVSPEPVTSEPSAAITDEERRTALEMRRDFGIELSDTEILSSRSQAAVPATLAGAL